MKCPVQGNCDRQDVCLADGECHYTKSPLRDWQRMPGVRDASKKGRASDRWDTGFLSLALTWAKMSKDPNTKVGAVLVGPNREVLSMGFNGLPHGIADTPERLNDRDLKNRLTVHAERNAVCLAARRGIATEGLTLYMTATDRSGAVWGGAPCVACTIELIQAGVRGVVTLPFKDTPSRWLDDVTAARHLLDEAGIGYREVEMAPDLSEGSFW